jgi:hypothetical protein
MEKAAPKSTASRKKAVLKACLLVAFVIASIYIVRFTAVEEFLTREALGFMLI